MVTPVSPHAAGELGRLAWVRCEPNRLRIGANHAAPRDRLTDSVQALIKKFMSGTPKRLPTYRRHRLTERSQAVAWVINLAGADETKVPLGQVMPNPVATCFPAVRSRRRPVLILRDSTVS